MKTYFDNIMESCDYYLSDTSEETDLDDIITNADNLKSYCHFITNEINRFKREMARKYNDRGNKK